MQLVETHSVPKMDTKIRLQEYAVGIFNTVTTKSAIKKAIKKQLILVNDKPTSTALFIYGGEKISLYQLENKNPRKELDLPLEILFEDDYLAVIYKPAGILVSGNKFVTIRNALAQNLTISSQKDAVKPQPIHRLDYPTSGVLLIGKTSSSIIALSKLFEERQIQKTYYAICIGKMHSSGNITTQVDCKNAHSNYQVLATVTSKRFSYLNLVKLSPKTGRKHQLRVHMSSIGNQLLGDKEYGNPDLILKGKGLYLHAYSLDFIHPFTEKQLTIKKEIPKKFKQIFPARKLS